MSRKQGLEQSFQAIVQRITRFGPSATYLNDLGGIYYELERLAEAEKAFETACRLDPSFDTAKANLARLRTEKANRVPAEKVRALLARLAPIAPAKELVRVGPMDDGGYLLPNDLDGIRYCFSPGVGPSSSFEKALEGFGIHSFLADASVDGPATALNDFTFDKLYVGKDDIPGQISLQSWVDRYVPSTDASDLLLQMDIEGAEYEVLNDASPAMLRRFRIIVIEFHNLSSLRDLRRYDGLADPLNKLLDDFHVVHLHPNNCCGSMILAGLEVPRVMEITFLRKDRDSGDAFVTSLPHPLDHDCVPENATLPLDPAFLRRV